MPDAGSVGYLTVRAGRRRRARRAQHGRAVRRRSSCSPPAGRPRPRRRPAPRLEPPHGATATTRRPRPRRRRRRRPPRRRPPRRRPRRPPMATATPAPDRHAALTQRPRRPRRPAPSAARSERLADAPDRAPRRTRLRALPRSASASPAAKALWLGVVKADALQPAAATQQKATIDVPARRGSITDRNGDELAVSAAGAERRRHPVPDRRPAEGRQAHLAGLLGRDEADVLANLSKKHTGFVWLARKLPIGPRQAAAEAAHRGARLRRGVHAASTRASSLASQLLGYVGTDNTGLPASSTSTTRPRAAATASACSSRTRSAQRSSSTTSASRGRARTLELTIDDRIQEETEKVLAEVGAKCKPAKGATAIVDEPAQRRAARGRQLAARRRQRRPGEAPDWAEQNRAVQPPTSRARPSRRSRSPARSQDGKITPDTVFQLPAQIQVADRDDRRGPRRGLRHADRRGRSSRSPPTSARSRSAALLGPDRFDHWVRTLRLRPADRRRPARRGGRHRAARARSTRAPRWATCRSARARP